MKKYRPNQKTLLAVVLSMAAFNASAAWTVNGTFCQSYSDDGQVLQQPDPFRCSRLDAEYVQLGPAQPGDAPNP